MHPEQVDMFLHSLHVSPLGTEGLFVSNAPEQIWYYVLHPFKVKKN